MQQNRCTTYYSLFHSDVRLYFTHGNFLTDPWGNISHWRGIRGTRKRKKRGGGRSDSTHVTIINSDCSMGMCIYSRANGEVCSNVCAPYAAPLSIHPRWRIQITSTKTPLPVYSKPHLGTGDENSPKRCFMCTCISPTNRALCFLQFARGFALLKIENRKEMDCGRYARIRFRNISTFDSRSNCDLTIDTTGIRDDLIFFFFQISYESSFKYRFGRVDGEYEY